MIENMRSGTAARENESATERRDERNFCINAVLGFLIAVALTTIGIIFGAIFAWAVFYAFAAIIVFAIVLTILIIAILIFKRCMKKKNACCQCKCCR